MPTSVIIGSAILGTGLSAYGAISGRNSASQMNKAQQEMTAQQQRIEAQRKQQMELEAKRNQLETLRQAQRARAVASTVATNQGGFFGSGLAGGLGQISGQEGTQLLSQGQNLEIGQNIFGINAEMANTKQSYASAQSSYQTAQAMTSLGGQIVNAGPAIGRVGGSLGSGMGYLAYGTNPFTPTGGRNPYYG